jgi:succinyl-diaminopimelate desuccinylase
VLKEVTMRYSEAIASFAQRCKLEYLRDLDSLIRIPSVSQTPVSPSEEAPFGIHCVQVLDMMTNMCDRHGLRTRTIGKVIGIAEYGDGPRELDIVSHLDVQPAGPGWETDPFVLTVSGDQAFGRGVSDNKGPALATLYAVRTLKEIGVPLRKTVRLVFGTGEEYGIADIRYYTEIEPAPPFMFTPDHKYPVVNTSKAGFTCTLSADFQDSHALPAVISVEGGDNVGAVPALCTARVREVSIDAVEGRAAELRKRTGIRCDVTALGTDVEIVTHGVSTHAVKADQGKNAVTAMLDLLCELPLAEAEPTAMLRSFRRLFSHGDVTGHRAGLYLSDDESGGSLYNLSIFRLSKTGLMARVRATLPASTSEEEFKALFRSRTEDAKLVVSNERFSPGRHVPLEDPYVAKLLGAYEHHTGQKAFGIAEGGGNYSHYFPHGVAFGCEPYGVDTRMHGAQEFVSIENVLTSISIIAQSIVEICG